MKSPDLSSLVTQRKLIAEPACPKCGGEPRVLTSQTTLLGWVGSENPNHIWEYSSCQACGFEFTIESKSGNVWITKDSKVLAGLPNCSESYIYTCVHCRGDVRRQHRELDGATPARSLLTTAADGPQYRTFYRCQGCKQEIEVAS